MPNRKIRPVPEDTTRERILKAAILRFSTHSYEETGLRDIAADVGVDICSTRPPKALQHHLKIYAPGAEPVAPEQIAERTRHNGPGIVILAVLSPIYDLTSVIG